jgi:hypothetical protein
MQDLIKQFPNESRKRQKPIVLIDNTPDNPAFKKRFFRELFSTLMIVAGFVIAGIIILILMGLLKLVGVKEL